MKIKIATWTYGDGNTANKIRLTADEGKALTKDCIELWNCIDVDSVEGWIEVDTPSVESEEIE